MVLKFFHMSSKFYDYLTITMDTGPPEKGLW